MTWDDGDTSTVSVGELIVRGHGDQADIAMPVWVGDKAEDVQVVFVVNSVGDGQFQGTAAVNGIIEYQGFDDEQGHTWKLADGWRPVQGDWWSHIRELTR